MTLREQQIRERAIQLWEAAGRPAGRDDEFWLEAEAQIQAENEALPDPAPPRGGFPR